MNIALAVVNNDVDISVYQEQFPSCQIFHTKHSALLMAFADLSLQIDRAIYLDNKFIDAVFVVRSHDRSFDKISQLLSCINLIKNHIFFLGKSFNTGSFICTPDIFAFLGSIYKLDKEKYKVAGHDTPCTDNEIFYQSIVRLGIDASRI